MRVTIKGVLIKKLDVESGVSAKGEWKKQQFCIEDSITNPQYPASYAFTSLNGKGSVENIPIGTMIEVAGFIGSKYYNSNGKEGWFTTINSFNVQVLGEQQQQSQPQYQQPQNQYAPPQQGYTLEQKTVKPQRSDDDSDNLPF